MKHTELMIGNLIAIHDGRTMRVVSLRGGYVFGAVDGYVGAIGEIYQRCQPIPITEELLLKNGFERYDKHSFHLRVKPCYTLYLVKPKDSQPWYCKVYGCGADDNYSINALYLHQLQNLCNIAGVEMEWKV